MGKRRANSNVNSWQGVTVETNKRGSGLPGSGSSVNHALDANLQSPTSLVSFGAGEMAAFRRLDVPRSAVILDRKIGQGQSGEVWVATLSRPAQVCSYSLLRLKGAKACLRVLRGVRGCSSVSGGVWWNLLERFLKEASSK